MTTRRHGETPAAGFQDKERVRVPRRARGPQRGPDGRRAGCLSTFRSPRDAGHAVKTAGAPREEMLLELELDTFVLSWTAANAGSCGHSVQFARAVPIVAAGSQCRARADPRFPGPRRAAPRGGFKAVDLKYGNP